MLFPYGIGGSCDSKRPIPVSLKHHIKYLKLADPRFQEHPSFMFTALSILQHHKMLLHAHLKVMRSDFEHVASQLASVSPEVIQQVSERVASGE
ncbi:hypothetical protein B0H14DRAFT_2283573, partial [Mycena olivaceomarginata]